MSSFSSKLPDVGTTIFTIVSRRARELNALNLGQGYPDYAIDPRLTELVGAAMQAGHNQYAPMEGLLSLRERIAEKFTTLFGANDPALYRLAQQVMAGEHRWLEGGIVGLMPETATTTSQSAGASAFRDGLELVG